MPGSSLLAALARTSWFRVASAARLPQLKASGWPRAETTMNAISRIGDVRPDRRLRFPALPVADSAGTSFKHEHLSAILAEGPQDGFFEVHAENYMGAGGPPHQA